MAHPNSPAQIPDEATGIWPTAVGRWHVGFEGTHRVIETIARDAYGFRNPGNQRSRTRRATTRRARGHLDDR